MIKANRSLRRAAFVIGETTMRSSLVSENRRSLKLCSGAARFYGLFLLSMSGVLVAVSVVMMVSGMMGAETPRRWFDLQCCSRLLTIAFGGILALVLAEFISYVLEGEGEPKWILRNGDKIVYAYVLFFAVMSILTVFHTLHTFQSGSWDFIPVMLVALAGVTQPLILIGIAITLKRVLPIIRESKLLV